MHSELEGLLRGPDCSAERFAAAFRSACEAALVAAYGRDGARAQAASRLLDDGNRRLAALARMGAASTSAQRSAPSAPAPAANQSGAAAQAAAPSAEQHAFWIGSAPRVSEMLALQAGHTAIRCMFFYGCSLRDATVLCVLGRPSN